MREQMNTKYAITNTIIGRGGYSEVRMGYSLAENQKVAIKIINLSQSSSPANLYHFGKEIEILTTLSHNTIPIPEVIKFYEVYQVKEIIYLVTEMAEGCELYDVCKEYEKKGGIPEAMAKDIFCKLVNAVNSLHSQEICHLDLKLENIMYNKKNKSLKIVDFGFASETAKLNFQTHENTLILQTNYCGSIHYSSPEVLKRIPYDGKRADVWSLGVILYTMLFARFPFNDISNLREDIGNKIMRNKLN